MNAEASGTKKRKPAAKSSSTAKKTANKPKTATRRRSTTGTRKKTAAKSTASSRTRAKAVATETPEIQVTPAPAAPAPAAPAPAAEQAAFQGMETLGEQPQAQASAAAVTVPGAPPRDASRPPATRAFMEELLKQQRRAFLAEGKVHLGVRLDRIDRCITLLVNHRKLIIEALDADFSGRARPLSLMSDVLDSLTQLKHTKRHLRRWVRPERRNPGLVSLLLGARACVRYEPKGVVGIMAPWNFPVNMIFNPLSNILGAGNRAMIKPSEVNPATAELMAELFPRYFEPTEIAVCTGGPEVGAIFSSLPFDHLIFTGGTEIGRKVLSAAAPNLTPVTLELGGKSPVIIGKSANLQQAVERIICGKMMNSGQACISPDYVFLPRDTFNSEEFNNSLEEFLHYAKLVFGNLYPLISGNPDYTSIVNEKHLQRLNQWLEDARKRGARVEELQKAIADDGSHRLPLHLVLEPVDEALVMQHELFGPVMVLRHYDDIDEVIDFINARPRPLALYYFGEDRKEEERILDSTCSGGVTINDVMMHASCSDLPFGGIGDSGMGNYHGFDGFRTFSHQRAMLRQGFTNPAKLFKMLPPYDPKTIDILWKQTRR